MTAADHDMMGEDDAACRHAAIPRVIGHRTADTAHQTACVQTKGEVNITQLYYSFLLPLFQIPLWVEVNFNTYHCAD